MVQEGCRIRVATQNGIHFCSRLRQRSSVVASVVGRRRLDPPPKAARVFLPVTAGRSAAEQEHVEGHAQPANINGRKLVLREVAVEGGEEGIIAYVLPQHM